MESPSGKRIAVIGSGISGLSAAWLLQRSGAKVTLYESESTVGGHTLTDDSSGFPVDLGFQVFNLTTYPHLTAFLDALGVDSEPSDMSFSLSVDGGRLEWASHSLDTVFAQRKNALSPTFLGMVRDVLRFGREAPKVLSRTAGAQYAGMTLGAYLENHRYSQAFIDNYVLPMCAAVWSVPSATVLSFPVTMLVRFWANHHLLDVTQRPIWRVVKGRSRSYAQKVIAELPDVRTATPVAAIKSLGPSGAGVEVTDGTGTTERFYGVVCATHSDVTLRLLSAGGGAPPAILNLLKGVPYEDNDVWLHTDASLMPKDRKTWASWNCLTGSGAEAKDRPVCVSYWVNSLQTLPQSAPDLFVTLNPVHEPAPDTVHRRLTMAHPVFGEATVAAQAKVPEVQGAGGIYLAGAWCGFGFHEDGIKSAIDAVGALGASPPWMPRTTSPKLSWLDSAAIAAFDKFAKVAIRTGRLRLILPTGQDLCYGEPAPPAGAPWRGRPPLNALLRIYDVAFFRKVIMRHDTGLGESYMDGDFEIISEVDGTGDLGALIAVLTANAHNIESSRGVMGLVNWAGDRALSLAHAARSNTGAGSRRNIEEHYDAGNDMYKLFLDETMTYSCGIWRAGAENANPNPNASSAADGDIQAASDLAASQYAKLDALIAKADLRPEHHVLEIGCGWGSFAMRAAGTVGCRVTGITLSKEQLAEATARVKAAGLSHLVTLLFCDYRDVLESSMGSYDRVVSCEMIEAVGHDHLRAYFMTVGAALKPGGRAVIQVIAEPDERYEAYCKSSDFIREHIFPGGHLPSVGACVEAARGTGLEVRGCDDIGPDYAVTLRAWRAAWEEKKDAALNLGYSERFWRKYQFYFAYCEGAFDARYIHTFQMTWVKDQTPTLTESDVRRAMTRSKAGLPVEEASSSAVALATPSASTDALTQVLMCVYFFLAGLAVAKSRVLWLLPVATAASAAAFWLVSLASSWLLPFYRALPLDRAALWSLQSVHLGYSAAVAAASAAYVATHPSALTLAAPQAPEPLPQALVAVSAGFFAFVLVTEVGAKLYKRNYGAIFHYTFLLVLFFAAAIKAVNTSFLAVTLLSEINTMFLLVRRQAALAGAARPGSLLARALGAADAVTFVTCRLVPHAAMGTTVLAARGAFPAPGTWWLAAAGMAYMNAVNVRHSVSFLRGSRQGPKEHAA